MDAWKIAEKAVNELPLYLADDELTADRLYEKNKDRLSGKEDARSVLGAGPRAAARPAAGPQGRAPHARRAARRALRRGPRLPGPLEVGAVDRFSGARRTLGFASAWRREPLSAMLVEEGASPTREAVHVIDKNLALLPGLGIDDVGLREFPLPVTPSEAETVRRGLESLGLKGFVILNPGGGWASKLWPAELLGVVARALRERGLDCLVTWGPGEEALADRVVAAWDGAALRCFPTTLLEYLELCLETRLVVAADTGPLHLACAVGAPVLGLFGPTDPDRNGPFSADDKVVRRVPLCSPCHRRRLSGTSRPHICSGFSSGGPLPTCRAIW